jgi:N-acetyl-anhydromuramyl-L-alanine amidase AmpD
MQVLRAQIEGMEIEAPLSHVQASALELMDKLMDLVVPFQTQVRVLQGGLGKMDAEITNPGKDWLSLVSDSVQTVTPGEEREQIQVELEEAPEIKDDKLAATVAALQAKIISLQKELEQVTGIPSAGPLVAGPQKIKRPPIQDLTGELHTHATEQYETRPRSAIQTIVIHHSAAPPTVGPQQIAAYHVNRLGWPGAGYHFMVAEDGIIYQANSVETVSYHAAKVNPRGVGICFLGNFSQEVPPPAQLLAGAHLVAWLMQELNVVLDEVKGHKELMSTACPGTQWLLGKNWKQMLHQGILQVQQKGQQDPDPTPAAKSMEHYVLFWSHDSQWAQADWLNAQEYIGLFRPSVGFSAEHAALAEYVTIIGGPLGVSQEVEERLKGQGCKVDRIAGKNEAETKQILDALIAEGRRFQGFEA